MDDFDNNERQLRIALFVISFILPIGVIGFMVIDDRSFLDALWITITTLTTIGYGDLVATSVEGRIFTLFLIVVGLGSFALALQAGAQVLFSPALRHARRRIKAEKKIRALRDHYVVCGEGELVDKTIGFLLNAAELRRQYQRDALSKPIEKRLGRFFGRKHAGRRAKARQFLQTRIVDLKLALQRSNTLLDTVVVITNNAEYAQQLRKQNILVINDDPTDDRALRRAGINHARAAMALLESDTETLLNVLTMRSRSAHVYIMATCQDDLAMKMIRVGANNVLAPYDIAGQFLNNATLRPAVNDFFNSIIFDHKASSRIIHIEINSDSPWLGKTIGDLQLHERYQTGVVGLRLDDGTFVYAPENDYALKQGDDLLMITPGPLIADLMSESIPVNAKAALPNWQRLPIPRRNIASNTRYTLMAAEHAIRELSQHYVICGEGRVIHSALSYLDPERPFVVVSHDYGLVEEMLDRGFRVVYGDLTSEDTLKRAGIERALAMMTSIDDDAISILAILNARTLNRGILITSTAANDGMIPKLRRAGADRVVSPFRIAAQFAILATIRPVVNDFMHYVKFNYQAGIETTELYMQNDSPWIGKTLKDLYLRRIFDAGVLGIRHQNGQFIYAPPENYQLQAYDVMIVTTPMQNADELRLAAHGEGRSPKTLRTDPISRTASGLNRQH